ncbi:flavodoxin family protein [Candidatus Omnitrophota bacterium]
MKLSSKQRVLVLHASHRQGFNTDALLEHFVSPIEKIESFICDHIHIPTLNISPCTSCFSCRETGICVIQDDMQECYKKISEADVVVVGTPVYFNTVPSMFKVFIDRCQPFFVRKFVLHKKLKEKTGYLLSCCDAGMGEPFVGVQKTVEALFYCCNIMLVDTFFCVLNEKSFNELEDEKQRLARFVHSAVDNLRRQK